MDNRVYKIKIINTTNNTYTIAEGTVEELIKGFQYTLISGESYQYAKGNKKVNTKPRTIKSLIRNLNKADKNRSWCGYPSYKYELV